MERLVESWKLQVEMLSRQLDEMLAGRMRTGSDYSYTTSETIELFELRRLELLEQIAEFWWTERLRAPRVGTVSLN